MGDEGPPQRRACTSMVDWGAQGEGAGRWAGTPGHARRHPPSPRARRTMPECAPGNRRKMPAEIRKNPGKCRRIRKMPASTAVPSAPARRTAGRQRTRAGSDPGSRYAPASPFPDAWNGAQPRCSVVSAKAARSFHLADLPDRLDQTGAVGLHELLEVRRVEIGGRASRILEDADDLGVRHRLAHCLAQLRRDRFG